MSAYEHPEGLLDTQERSAATIRLAGEGADPGPYPRGTFRKVATAMVTLAMMVIATYVVPALSWARPWTSCRYPALSWACGERHDAVPYWNVLGRHWLERDEAEAEAEAEAELDEAIARARREPDDQAAPLPDRPVAEVADGDPIPRYEPHADDEREVPQALEDPTGTALDPFYARLALTHAGREAAVTRVSQWGDSVMGTDNVTAAVRHALQRRFGDAGHGFHLLAPSHGSYRHEGVAFASNRGWRRCYIISECAEDGRYGFGGSRVSSAGGGQTTVGTADKGSYGRKVQLFEIWYAAIPDGGDFQVRVDGGEPTVVETAAESTEDRVHAVEVDDGAHSFEVRAVGEGKVQLYGTVLERDGPGVVWDSLAQIGSFTRRMLNFDPVHLAGQIERRDPHLLVFMFGGNDLHVRRPLSEYKRDYLDVLARFRGDGEGKRACLIVAPVDHGRREGAKVITMPRVPKLVQTQREVAIEAGCAFFDTFEAMGGKGSAGRWRRRGLLAGDLAHLTEHGQRVVGDMLYLALMKGYRDYRARTDAQ